MPTDLKHSDEHFDVKSPHAERAAKGGEEEDEAEDGEKSRHAQLKAKCHHVAHVRHLAVAAIALCLGIVLPFLLQLCNKSAYQH